MNILISSTTTWNPGDDFIRDGVRHLIESIYPGPHSYYLYTRNPDTFVGGPHDTTHKEKVWTNAANSFLHNVPTPDLVVLAGTPEWLGPPLAPLFDYLASKQCPLLAVGVGSSHPLPGLTKHEWDVLSRPTSTIITRSKELQAQLHELDLPRALAMPCPALFCHDTIWPPGEGTGIIVQGTEAVNQSVSSAIALEAAKLVGERAGFYVADTTAEFTTKIYHSFDHRDYYSWALQKEKIVSTRLHGAVMGLALGKPTVLLNDNYRVNTAAAMFAPVLKRVSKAADVSFDISRDQVLEWKYKMKDQWMKVLRGVL